MTVKNEELINEVVNTYTKTEYGYRRLATYITETRNIKVSHQTIKRWLQSAGVEAKEPKQVKYGSRAFYKQEYKKLLKRVETLEKENMELKEALELYEEHDIQIKELKKARERDIKVINMLYEELLENCNKDTRVRVSEAYTKAYGLDKARRAQTKKSKEDDTKTWVFRIVKFYSPISLKRIKKKIPPEFRDNYEKTVKELESKGLIKQNGDKYVVA